MKNKQKDSPVGGIINNGLMQHLLVFRLCEERLVKSCVQKLEKTALVISEITGIKQVDIKKAFKESMNADFKEILQKTDPELMDYHKMLVIPGIHEPEGYANNLHIRFGNSVVFTAEDFLETMLDDMNAHEHCQYMEATTRYTLLMPPVIAYNGESPNLLHCTLIVSTSGLCIVKIEYNIKEIEIITLSRNRLNMDFTNVKMPICTNDGNFGTYGYSHCQDTITTFKIAQKFMNAVFNAVEDISTQKEKICLDYNLLYLFDYSSKPHSPNSSQVYKRDIIYLLAAPMEAFNEPSNKKIEEVLEKASYEINKYGHVYVSEMGRSIAVTINDNKNEIATVTEMTEEDAGKAMKNGFIQGLTPAIEAVLFKALTKLELYRACENTQGKNLNELLKIKEKIHRLTLQENVSFLYEYRTMGDLTRFINTRYSFPLPEHQIDRLLENFNDTVHTIESINRERTKNIYSFVGVALSLILSFNGIREIIAFVNRAHGLFYPYNERALLLFTTIVWGILVLTVAVCYFVYNNKKRKL